MSFLFILGNYMLSSKQSCNVIPPPECNMRIRGVYARTCTLRIRGVYAFCLHAYTPQHTRVYATTFLTPCNFQLSLVFPTFCCTVTEKIWPNNYIGFRFKQVLAGECRSLWCYCQHPIKEICSRHNLNSCELD